MGCASLGLHFLRVYPTKLHDLARLVPRDMHMVYIIPALNVTTVVTIAGAILFPWQDIHISIHWSLAHTSCASFLLVSIILQRELVSVVNGNG